MKLVGLILTVLLLVSPAWAIEGKPYAKVAETVSSTVLSPPFATCTIAGVVTPAVLEVLTNGVYYTMESATATPSSTTHYAAANTVVEVEYMELFRYVRATGSDAAVIWTCFDLSHGKTRVGQGG